MSIDFTGVTGIEDDYGNLTKITDASGRVLWSATIKFTINGDTYIADRGMTWAEWFASDYNTTGETEGDIKDANGNEVSMDAVIVGGTAYEVGFDDGMRTVNLSGVVANAYGQSMAYFEVNGEKYYRDIISGSIPANQIYTFPIGTQIKFVAKAISSISTTTAKITLNGGTVTEKTATKGGGEVVATYDYVLNGNVNVMLAATAIQSGTMQNATTTIDITEE